MKKLLIISFLLTTILQACKKDAPNPSGEERRPEVIVKDIAAKLSGADSLSSFTDAFKNLKLTEEDTKEGLTIFAPLNNKRKVNAPNAGKNTPKSSVKTDSVTASLLKDYIVKGVFKLSDLTNGKILTALSGKKLNVFRDSSTIRIDDFLLSKNAVFGDANSSVFAITTEIDSIIVIDTISTTLLTEETFLQVLKSVENDINISHKNFVVLDGVLSHDAELDSLPNTYKNSGAYREIANFSLNPANAIVTKSWIDAYKIINKLNYLEVNAPVNLSNKSQKVATIQALRAYAYIQLLSYFGNIALLPKIPNVSNPLSNTDKQGVINFINTELASAMAGLPNVQTDTLLLNKNIAKAIYAKAALLQKDYQKVSQLTEDIINSAVYFLQPVNSVFDNTSKEIIWNNSAGLNKSIKTYFYSRANLPYIRYTEILLMNAEANLVLGNNQKAQSIYAMVLQRSAKFGNISADALQQTWSSEMKREGNSFTNLIRWNTAQAVLVSKGFSSPKNKLLPIPQSEIDLSANFVQNPGY